MRYESNLLEYGWFDLGSSLVKLMYNNDILVVVVLEVLESVIGAIRSRWPEHEARLIETLANRYYTNISSQELSRCTSDELYALVVSHWELMRGREPGDILLKISTLNELCPSSIDQRTVILVSIDNMPFLVDSLQICLNRLGYGIETMYHFGGFSVDREDNQISEFKVYDAKNNISYSEAPIGIVLNESLDKSEYQKLTQGIIDTLTDVYYVVTDWAKMREKMQESIDSLIQNKSYQASPEVEESIELLRWLLDNHFTFLGCRDYEVKQHLVEDKNITEDGAQNNNDTQNNKEKSCGKEWVQCLIPDTGLGVLRILRPNSKKVRRYSDLPAQARKVALDPKQTLIISKTNTSSTVHRDAYSDYVGVKLLDSSGNVCFERRFIGLFTSSAYSSNPKTIPILRQKVKAVIVKSVLPSNSHSGKDLDHILATLPRDDLFHSSVDELYSMSMGVLQLQDRRQIRLFLHKDAYGRYISALVYLPKENFNTDVLIKMRDILVRAFSGTEVSFNTFFSETVLCRIHFVVRIDPSKELDYNINAIEQQLIEVGRSWRDALKVCLQDYFGMKHARDLFLRYRFAFDAGYRIAFLPEHAILDVEKIEKLCDESDLEMTFYRPLNAPADHFCLKLYHLNSTISLSDILPMLEGMGLRVIGEQPYMISLQNNQVAWINDFIMTHYAENSPDLESVKDVFEEAFKKVWMGQAENDSLNRLVMLEGMNWREVNVLRAYTAYFRQLGVSFSQEVIEKALIDYPRIAVNCIMYFHYRFDPELSQGDENSSGFEAKENILKMLESVRTMDEDHILRFFVDVIGATQRTNYYQKNQVSEGMEFLSFKIDSYQLSQVPLPRPRHGVFVYSSDFEAVHLRRGAVARGGIRWSSRLPHDLRREILGLMKTQEVKNAVIVPTGAKGGFVVKYYPDKSREAFLERGLSCYRVFIRALLGLTDNRHKGVIIPPLDTVCHDGYDSYLVVAADKGTATFSDVANEIATEEKNFWLADAFASGGSTGYDHKKMGITARGAWVSALHHFYLMGKDVSKESFTVVGIGDMSGDVFGNGLLLSRKAKLVAAFNHMHIFLDPDPDPELSFQERERLFKLPRSGWSDYNIDVLSTGGAVFDRTAKFVELTPQIKQLLNIDEALTVIEPNALIRAILQAKVDLFWNGGIGTYVKSIHETDADVGDRSNDMLRVTADHLGAAIVAEGGNLGLTQAARVEYALSGGRINTDFIDNSAGVDCSDHEVNIKILLADVVARAEITMSQRNTLLAKMTDDVAQLVLKHNDRQNFQLAIADFTSLRYMNLYQRYIYALEEDGIINRELEGLPDNSIIEERRISEKGLTRPELAVLMAYTKIKLQHELLNGDLIDEPIFVVYLMESFPKLLQKTYPKEIEDHQLRRELIATEFSHRLVSDMGISYIYQIQDETGASVELIAKAYEVARRVFQMGSVYKDIRSLDGIVEPEVQIQMSIDMMNLVRRAARWLVRCQPDLSMQECIDRYKQITHNLYLRLPKLLLGSAHEELINRKEELVVANVPESLAMRVACAESIFHALNITEATLYQDTELYRVAKIYFMLVDRLDLLWFREQIDAVPSDSRWSVLAKSAFKADLDQIQRELTIGILNFQTSARSIPGRIKAWAGRLEDHLERWRSMLVGFGSGSIQSFAIIAVALKLLQDISKIDLSKKPGGDKRDHKGSQATDS